MTDSWTVQFERLGETRLRWSQQRRFADLLDKGCRIQRHQGVEKTPEKFMNVKFYLTGKRLQDHLQQVVAPLTRAVNIINNYTDCGILPKLWTQEEMQPQIDQMDQMYSIKQSRKQSKTIQSELQGQQSLRLMRQKCSTQVVFNINIFVERYQQMHPCHFVQQ